VQRKSRQTRLILASKSQYRFIHETGTSIASRMSGPSDFIFQSVPIPEYKTGWIIGKRGSYIKQLEKKSGATITISDSTSKEYGTVWKYVQISGSGRAVDRAKKLLHIRLERLEPRSVEEDDFAALPDAVDDPLE